MPRYAVEFRITHSLTVEQTAPGGHAAQDAAVTRALTVARNALIAAGFRVLDGAGAVETGEPPELRRRQVISRVVSPPKPPPVIRVASDAEGAISFRGDT